ncbi:MAG: flagellar biosynthesis protein FlhF [Phycisphaerales bacterium]
MAETTLKTYRARTMGEALTEVKRDLGKGAVILHTRSYRVGGWMGLGGRSMVEITASVGVNILPLRDRRAPAAVAAPMPAAVTARAPREAVERAYAGPVTPVPGLREQAPATDWSPARFAAIGSTSPRRADQTPGGGSDPAPSVQTVVRGALACHAVGEAKPHRDALEDEVASIKRMVGQVLQCSRHTAIHVGAAHGHGVGGGGGTEGRGTSPMTPAGSLTDPLFRQYLRMLESEVAAEIADEVVGRVRDELTPAELADESIVRATAARRLAAIIPADADTPAPGTPGDHRPLTIALIGPTGVGKTTTVAKLAAAYKLRHGRKVALVTSDTYRIAAVDQLRTYAEIIGLPLKVVLTPSEMAAACAALVDQDVILIDTAGRSPGDAARLEELRRFIAAARPHQTHLVLSGTSSQGALLEAAGRFASVNPDRVIFTKLDEAVNYGVLFNVAQRVALRLSYVTTGQEVPDHIEQGRSDRLARLILDGGRVR